MRKHYYAKFHNSSAFSINKYLLRLFFCVMPALAAGFIIFIVRRSSPYTVERVYSSNIFVRISALLGTVSRWSKYSITSVIYILLAAAVVVLIVSFMFFMLTSPDKAVIAGLYLKIVVFIVSIIFFLFSVLCMPNYYRLTFAQNAGIELNDYTVDDLESMCVHLIEQTNLERNNISEPKGHSFYDTSEKAKAAFDALSSDYPFLGKAEAAAKPFLFSKLLTVLNLTGFYFPYTAEANVNTHMPETELPFTICHELSHTRGFMRENEANYIGFIACMRSDDSFIRYSGLYCALMHSMNSLYDEDSERYFKLRELYSEPLSYDCAVLSDFWQPYFDTPAAELSNSVNDVYLKANDLSDGIKSYGRMVDLLMAQYLKNGTLV